MLFKITKPESRVIRRGIFVVTAIIIMAVGLTFMRYAYLGLDPVSCLNNGVSIQSGLPFGVCQVVVFMIMLAGILFIDRSKLGFGTFCNMIGVGFISDACLWLIGKTIPDYTPVLYIRIIALAVGLLILYFGAALYFEANMGVAPYDAIALIIVERLHKPQLFRWIRIGTDALCVAGGILTQSNAGAGTILSVCLGGPLIAFYRTRIKNWL